MEIPVITNQEARQIIAWATDVPIADGESVQDVVLRDAPEGTALFQLEKPADKDWSVRLYLRIEITDK